jgi:hypothetical protein
VTKGFPSPALCPDVGGPKNIICFVMVEAVGSRSYGCRAVLLYSQWRPLMWKQTDKSPFRDITINYFKWS